MIVQEFFKTKMAARQYIALWTNRHLRYPTVDSTPHGDPLRKEGFRWVVMVDAKPGKEGDS